MIKVLIPSNLEFKKYENQVRFLYEQNQEKICDTNTFDFIRDNTLFYLFLSNGEIIGVIYYFLSSNKLFLNGFGNRKFFSEKIFCLLWFTTTYLFNKQFFWL